MGSRRQDMGSSTLRRAHEFRDFLVPGINLIKIDCSLDVFTANDSHGLLQAGAGRGRRHRHARLARRDERMAL